MYRVGITSFKPELVKCCCCSLSKLTTPQTLHYEYIIRVWMFTSASKIFLNVFASINTMYPMLIPTETQNYKKNKHFNLNFTNIK